MTRRQNPLSLTFVSAYPAELKGGGGGVGIPAATTASVARQVALVPGENVTVHNDGAVSIWFLLGTAPSVLATLEGTPVPAGCKEVFRVPEPEDNDDPDYTWVSVITRSGTSYVTFNPIGVGT